MATIANPALASLFPTSAGSYVPTNATGNQVNVGGPSATNNGANPLLPAPGTSTAAPSSTNPLTAGFSSSSVPTFGANGPGPTSLLTPGAGPTTNVGQAATSPVGGMNTMSPTDLSRMYSDLKKTYGDGVAHQLMDFLTSGAGFNQDAVNNLFAAMQPQIERGTESLANQFSTTGNRFGSGAQIGMADYLSQVNLNEGQMETQMYESAVSNYINTLMGTASQNAQRKAATPSVLDDTLAIAGTVIPGAAMAAQALRPTGIGAAPTAGGGSAAPSYNANDQFGELGGSSSTMTNSQAQDMLMEQLASSSLGG
jgi:hypothetical protein